MYGKLGFPALGAVGCGFATSAVFWLQLLLLLAYISRGKHYKPYKLFERLERPDWATLRDLLKVGLPIAVMIFVEGSLFVGAALFIGRLGAIPAAAHLVAINFAALTFMVPLGIATAVTVRVGNALGRGEPRAARYAGISGLAIVLAFASLSSTIMLVFPEGIVALYTDEEGVRSVAIQLLFLAAIFQFSDGIQVGAAGGLRGLKDTTVPMFYSVVAYWIVGMTIGYQLTFSYGLGPRGMWIGMIAGLTVGAFLLSGRFWRTVNKLIAAKHGLNSAA
jgi:MATE family multidrug resistance protein